MPQIGPMEILVVGILALMVFGPDKLPGMARSVGRVLNQVKTMASEAKSEFDMSLDDKEDEKNKNKVDDTVVAGAADAPTGADAPIAPTDSVKRTPAPVVSSPSEDKASDDAPPPSSKEPVMATKS